MSQETIQSPASTTWRIPVNYTASQLVYAIQHAKSHPDDFYQPMAYGSQRMTAEQYLTWFRRRLHAKINRASKDQERQRYGRKDGGDGYCSDYERSTSHIARKVNTPRLIVRVSECPKEFREQLAHRLSRPEDF